MELSAFCSPACWKVSTGTCNGGSAAPSGAAGEGLAADKWKRRKAVELLKCLLTHLGRPLHRERLIEYLWPDADMNQGWERLKVVISFLRKQLRTGDDFETKTHQHS